MLWETIFELNTEAAAKLMCITEALGYRSIKKESKILDKRWIICITLHWEMLVNKNKFKEKLLCFCLNWKLF